MVFSFEYYYKTTKDMLLAAPMPIYMGYASNTYTNIGEANNRGIEMNLEWRDKTESGFEYNVGVNMSTIRNRMTKLNGGTPISDGPCTSPIRMKVCLSAHSGAIRQTGLSKHRNS